MGTFIKPGFWIKSKKGFDGWLDLIKLIQDNSSSSSVSPVSYASNVEAVAALGVGKLYKSTTLINGSPIILITI